MLKKILFLALLPTAFVTLSVVEGFSQWNLSSAINTPVAVAVHNQQSEKIVTDSKGGAIIAWEDSRLDTNHADIYVQRLDKNGYPKWTLNGINICSNDSDQGTIAMAADGFGGAIIAWNDHRAADRDVYAQRIDSSGNILWTANGVAVSGAAKPRDQRDSKLIADGSGGAIIVWQDSSLTNDWDIVAQRVSGSGTLTWAASGVAICNDLGAQKRPRIRTDGAGGAIIVWQDKRNGLDYDIYAKRINSSGTTVSGWGGIGGYGIIVCSEATGATQKNPIMESDGAGGAIIAWEDKRNPCNGCDSTDIYAQRVNASGTMQWTTNGIPVCTSVGLQSYLDMAVDGTNGAFIVWKDFRSDLKGDIYAQRVNASGVMQWASNGILIKGGPNGQGAPAIVPDGWGNALIAYRDSGTSDDIYGVKVNSSGIILWNSPVGTAAGTQNNPRIVMDGNGGCIYAFEDARNLIDNDIYAHHLYASGSADGVAEENYYVESKCFPNPFSSSAVIEIMSPFIKGVQGDVAFFIYDLVGKKVEIPFAVSLNKINIARGNLQSGIYFYEIRNGNNAVSKGKLILTD
ncbi:MAG: T9SS type A sorting domain-containing protein [Bacteroidetes bacterium]|nr:T9SS type A sorting domain-containing protein [Bacteroidota bacterium]